MQAHSLLHYLHYLGPRRQNLLYGNLNLASSYIKIAYLLYIIAIETWSDIKSLVYKRSMANFSNDSHFRQIKICIKLLCFLICNLINFRETVPNSTSGKIKLTPPAYSHTTVLLVSSLNFGLLARG